MANEKPVGRVQHKMAATALFGISEGTVVVLGEPPKNGDSVCMVPVGYWKESPQHFHSVTEDFTEQSVIDCLMFSADNYAKVYRKGAHVGSFFLKKYDSSTAFKDAA